MSLRPEEHLRRGWDLLVQHQGLAIPLGYVALILLGMFHMVIYYARFKINALDFAEPGDFLLAPLSDPFVIVVSILPFFLFRLLRRLDPWWARLRRRIEKPATPEQEARYLRRTSQLQGLALVLWIVAFSLTYARNRGEKIEDGRTRRMRVELVNGQHLGTARDSTVALIGTTSKYAFFYVGRRDSSTGPPSVTIVPVENVERMDLTTRRPAR